MGGPRTAWGEPAAVGAGGQGDGEARTPSSPPSPGAACLPASPSARASSWLLRSGERHVLGEGLP